MRTEKASSPGNRQQWIQTAQKNKRLRESTVTERKRRKCRKCRHQEWERRNGLFWSGGCFRKFISLFSTLPWFSWLLEILKVIVPSRPKWLQTKISKIFVWGNLFCNYYKKSFSKKKITNTLQLYLFHCFRDLVCSHFGQDGIKKLLFLILMLKYSWFPAWKTSNPLPRQWEEKIKQ